MVFIQFSEDMENNQAAIEAQRRVSSIRSSLPKDADDPTVSKIDPDSMPMMNIVVTSPRHSSDDLYPTVSDVVQPTLQALPGIADASISGGRDREIQIQMDTAKMEGFEITVDQITSTRKPCERWCCQRPAVGMGEGEVLIPHCLSSSWTFKVRRDLPAACASATVPE